MKRIILILSILIFGTATAQSRLYFSGGMSSSFGGNINTLFASERFGHACFDLEWDRKMMGSFHSLIGLSYFRVGYFSEENVFGSMSRFRGDYLALPVMFRFNVADRNQIYIEAGPSPYYLLNATLEEGITRFGVFESNSANITAYSNHFYMAFRFQFSVAFGRFIFSEVIMWQGEGNPSTKDLANHWFLNAQESTYLLSQGYADFMLFGFKVGMRLK